MLGIMELIKKYGMNLDHTKALMPELSGTMGRKVKPLETLSPPPIEFYTAEEAMQFGVELEAGWKLKVVPPVNGGQPAISYLTPEDWELTQDQMWVSPTGQRFTPEQMEAQEAGEASDYGLLYQEYQRTGGELSVEEWEAIGAPLRPFTEQVFGKLFPDGDVQQLIESLSTEDMPGAERQRAEKAQDDLIRDLWDIGRNKDTEALLRQLGADEAQIEELFAPAEDRRFLGPTAMGERPKPREGLSWTTEEESAKTPVIKKGVYMGAYEKTEFEKGIETLSPELRESVSITMPTVEFESEGIHKDTLDTLVVGIQELILNFQSGIDVVSMGFAAFRKKTDFVPIRQAGYDPEEIISQGAERIASREREFEAFVKAHPDMAPDPRYEEAAWDNPELLKEPEYWTHWIAKMAGYSIAAAGGALVGGAVGGPAGAFVGATAVLTPVTSGDLYQSLIGEGATPEQAASVSTVLGPVLAGFESLTEVIGLSKLAPGVSQMLTEGFYKTMGEHVFRQAVGRFGKTFTAIQAGEIVTEQAQNVIENLARQSFNETIGTWDNWDTVLSQTMVGTTGFGLFGGGAAAISTPGMGPGMKRVYEEERGALGFPQPEGVDFEGFKEAVENTEGARWKGDKLEIQVQRYQKPEQAGEPSVRAGVFYLPELASPYKRYYTTGRIGYGGKQKIEGKRVIVRPIVAKGASGGNVPKRAYDELMGKGSYEVMRTDVLEVVTKFGRKVDEGDVYEILEQYGGNPDLADIILENSKEGNTLAYAIQEHIVAAAVRKAGYDSIVGYSKSGGKMRLSEVFMVKEEMYPSPPGLLRQIATEERGAIGPEEIEPEAPELAPIPENPAAVGKSIAEQTGLSYEGVQEGVGLQFTDVEGTGTTFYGNTLEEVQRRLAETRKEFAEAEAKAAEAKPALPEQIPGEPEAGVQPGMFGGQEVVRPKGKGKVTQIGMDDALKLEQIREAAEPPSIPAQKADVAYESYAEAEGLKTVLESDPVAQKRIWVGKSKKGTDLYRDLTFFISLREQSFPDYFTVKQAQMLYPGHEFAPFLQPGTRIYNRVPRDVALDELSKELGMTPDEIAERVEAIRQERRTIQALNAKIEEAYTKTPVKPLPETTPAEAAENKAIEGRPKYTLKQINTLVSVFADYLTQPTTMSAWELTRELRREERSKRAENLKAKTQELMVKDGMSAEQAMTQAIAETMAGELPSVTTEYLEGFTEDLRDAMFAKVLHVLKNEPYEMASTKTALTNALAGKPIPREPGVKGGSAYSRLERVFGDKPKVLRSIDKMAKEQKPLSKVIEGLFFETGKPPLPIDEDMAAWLRKLKNIPYGVGTLFEKPSTIPEMPVDTRTADQKEIDLENFKLELAPDVWESWTPEYIERLSYLRINLLKEEYQSKLFEAGWTPPAAIEEQGTPAERALALDLFKIEMAKPPTPPVTKFEAPIEEAFEQVPLMRLSEKKVFVQVLKQLQWLPFDIGNFIRANLSSFDFSFWRQMSALIAGHPKSFIHGNIEAMRCLVSQEHTDANREWVTRNPRFELYERIRENSGADPLRLPLETKGTEQYRATEEFGYASANSERLIPRFTAWLPHVRLSGRHFVGGINTMAWDIWNGEYDAAMRKAEKIASGEIKLLEGEAFDLEAEMTDAQKYLADMSQRASLGKLSPAAPALGGVLFTPRGRLAKIIAPTHLLGLSRYGGEWRFNPRIMRMAWKDFSLFVGTFSGIIMLGAWIGLWETDTDPRSANFMSIRIGNTRIDPWGGYRTYINLYARLITGTGISSVTGAEYEIDPLNTTTRFMRGSLAPGTGILVDFVQGETFVGEEFDPGNLRQWVERIAPFALQDIWGAFEEDWKTAAIVAIPAVFGAGVQTYTGDWVDDWPKLGLPKYSDNLGYGLTEPYYDTADFWSDNSSQFKGVDPATLTKEKGYPDYIRSMVEARVILEKLKVMPNQKLVRLNADPEKGLTFGQYYQQWREREKIVATGDEERLKEFDQDERTRNADKGNFSQRQFALLNEYWAITDEAKQAEFLKEHKAEIGTDIRQEYIRSHPKENALLAHWGQVKLLTKEAAIEVRRLMVELDTPETAIPEMTLPPEESIENYSEYQEIGEERGWNSWEAQLLIAKDDKLRGFLKRDMPTSPLAALELKVEHIDLYDEWAAYGEKDSPSYILDDKEREEAVNKLKADNPQWVDDMRRVEAIENRAEDSTIESWVERGKLVDEFSSNSSEVKEWLLDNPDVHKWAIEQELLTDDGSDWNENVLRINTKWRELDDQYQDIGDARSEFYIEDDDERAVAREKLLADNEEYRIDRRRRDAYGLSGTGAGEFSTTAEISDSIKLIEKSLATHGVPRPADYTWLTDEEWKDFDDKWVEHYGTILSTLNDIRDGKLNKTKINQALQLLHEDISINENTIKTWEQSGTEYQKTVRTKDLQDAIERYDDVVNLLTGALQHAEVGRFPEELIEDYVSYHALPTKGYRRERMLIENQDLAEAMQEFAGIELPDPKKIPPVGYDDTYEKFQTEFEKLSGFGDFDSEFFIDDADQRAAARYSMRYDRYGNPTPFAKAEKKLDAYSFNVPEAVIPTFVDWYTSPALNKPADWGYDLWYEDDWYLMENPRFYQTMLDLKIWLNPIDFSKVPTRRVFDLYQRYDDLRDASGKADTKARKRFRAMYREFDAWGVLKFGWTPAR